MLFLSGIISPCFVCVFVRCRSDLSASAVLYAHDRYCRGLGRVLVLIIHGHHDTAVLWSLRGFAGVSSSLPPSHAPRYAYYVRCCCSYPPIRSIVAVSLFSRAGADITGHEETESIHHTATPLVERVGDVHLTCRLSLGLGRVLQPRRPMRQQQLRCELP